MRSCSVCGRLFKRLDVHLRWSKRCRDPLECPPLADKSLSEEHLPLFSQHSEISVNVTSPQPVSPTSFIPSLSSCHTTINTKPPLALPKPSDLESWYEVDKHLEQVVLPLVVNEPDLNKKVDLFSTLTYSYFESHHGTHNPTQYQARSSRKRKHQRLLKSIRNEKNEVRRAYRSAIRSEQPRNVIVQLATQYHLLVRKHNKVQRDHIQRDFNKRMKAEQHRFTKDIWKYCKSLLDDHHSAIDPSFTKDQAQEFFETTYSNGRDTTFETPSWMSQRKRPFLDFDFDPISLDEIKHQVKKCRNGSAPSPVDQISYIIMKKCPSASLILMDIFNACMVFSSFPTTWQTGVIKLISKPAASSDPSNPSNFRPIALTSCMGKVFTSVLKHRLLDYATRNNYLDLSIQKAFADSIPGCIEHHFKLSSALNEAKQQQKNICICWIDLANAYGSVHHNLIFLALEHYHLPKPFIDLVRNIYSGLSAIISTKQWNTTPFPLRIGIFQGDPMSVIIFNLVINLFVEFISENYHQLGYHFSGSQHCLPLLQYADDSCLVSSSEENGQVLCHATEKWLFWANMSAKVPKCRVLVLKRGKLVPSPNVSLNNLVIPPVDESSFKFLGLPVSNTMTDSSHREIIRTKLKTMLSSVDSSLLKRKQKLSVYSKGVCPRLAWLLLIILIPISWVERNLDSIAHSYLKKWAGLARCASVEILHLSRSEGGLGLPLLSTNFKKLQVSRIGQLTRSRDEIVLFLVQRLAYDEANSFGRAFLPTSIIQDLLERNPHLSKNHLKKQAAAVVSSQDEMSQLRHLRSLEVQGECYRLDKDQSVDIWSRAVSSLPDLIFKFALNATLDTLPHLKNLKKWGKSPTDECPLCCKTQSLVHVLNACQISLSDHRFTNRHNEILLKIAHFIQDNTKYWIMIVDHPTKVYRRPTFLVSDLRPDIVLWSDERRQVRLVELTVCFDTSFENATERKRRNYNDLSEEIKRMGYECDVITLQVGSRGFVDTDSFERLRKILNVKSRNFTNFLREISSVSIKESFKIWSSRNTPP